MQNIGKIDFSNIKAFLFDLDATLGAYVQNELSALYFERLGQFALKTLGERERFEKAASAAFQAMKKNDGSKNNGVLFHEIFYSLYPDFTVNVDDFYDDYYRSAMFHEIGTIITHPRGTEKPLLKTLRAKGYSLVCATNPVFPASANDERMSWAGLCQSDFDFVTLHTNSRFCKPSAGYFTDTAARLSLAPEECLMVGNDTLDDLEADKAGMPVLLVTDYLKDRGNRSLEGVPRCTFEELVALCEKLPERSKA